MDIHGTRPKFYIESTPNNDDTMSQVIVSETYMVMSRLFRIIENDDDLKV